MNPVKIFNRLVYPFTSDEELCQFVFDKKGILIAVGCEKLLNNDEKLIDIINHNYAYCDGVAAVFALHKRGYGDVIKIPGAELWLKLISFLPETTKYYLLGGKQEIIDKTVQKLQQEYKINIVGYHNGFFDKTEIGDIKQDIYNARPDVIFVAMGSPKQEFLMNEMLQEYPALYMGLGGSFDLYTGNAKPVPLWWKKIFKWEGAYRLMNDIRNWKRWKRQTNVFHALWLLLINKF